LWTQHRFLSPGESSVFSRLVAYAKNDEDKEVCCTRAVGDYAHTLYRARLSLFPLSLSLCRVVYARPVYARTTTPIYWSATTPDVTSTGTATSNPFRLPRRSQHPATPSTLSYIRAPTKCQHPKRAQPLNTRKITIRPQSASRLI